MYFLGIEITLPKNVYSYLHENIVWASSMELDIVVQNQAKLPLMMRNVKL